MATREETKRMIEVMQAYVDGAEIEAASIGGNDWSITYSQPIWNFREMKYRIAKPKTRKVKLLAWFNGAGLFYYSEELSNNLNTNGVAGWKRVPSEDKEIEIEG